MVDIVARIMALVGLVFSGLLLLVRYLAYRKDKSKLQAISLFIDPERKLCEEGLCHLIKVGVCNFGQRKDSIIEISVVIVRGKEKKFIYVLESEPTIRPSQPLVFEEKTPKEIEFYLPLDDALCMTAINLTTAARKDIRVNPKWIREQVKLLDDHP